MVQIIDIPERKPSFSQRLSGTLQQGLQGLSQYAQQKQQSEAIRKTFGDEIANLPPEYQKMAAEYVFKKQLEEQKQAAKYSEKLKAYEQFRNKGKELKGKSKIIEQEEKAIEPEVLEKKIEEEKPPYTKEDIEATYLFDRDLAKMKERENKEFKQEKRSGEKEERRIFEADRNYHSTISRPIIQKANERLKISEANKGVREGLKQDIASGNTSGFFPYMVDKLGLESFRNPESARFSNEVKHLFVGSLNEIPGARPNQFLERLLSAAQPMIGRSVEANLSVMDIADMVEDIRDQQAKLELEVANEENKIFGFAKDDITQKARERMGDYANRKQEETAIKIRQRHENTLDDSSLINELISGEIIPGTYITPRMAQIIYIKNGKDSNKSLEDIKKYGFKLPEYLDRYEQ